MGVCAGSLTCHAVLFPRFLRRVEQLDLPVSFKVFFQMDVSSRTVTIISVFLLTVILNLFFGYFRARERKYSFRWFLYIHLPIPAIIIARVYSGLDYRYIPLFVFAAVVGQLFGGKLEI